MVSKFRFLKTAWSLLFVFIFILTGCSVLQSNPIDKRPTVATEPPNTLSVPILPKSNIFGAQLDQLTPEKGLLQMVQAKSAWTRRDYVWSLVEPNEGDRNWDAVKYFEDELITASQNNINVILILLDAPSWARTEATCGGKVKPDKYPALASFVHDLVDRYSRPPYNLKYVEMWNEPDVDGFLGCWGDINDTQYYGGQAYGDMLKVVYPAAKSANPEIQLLVGGLLLDCDPTKIPNTTKDCTPAYFLKGILERGASNAFDGVAFHSGDYYLGVKGQYYNPNFVSTWNTTGPVTAAKSAFLNNLLAQYNVTGKYLINTEAGIKCGDPAQCSLPEYGFEETKAYYMIEDGVTALARNYQANIWYSVYGDRFSGLLTLENQPLPVYYAFQYMTMKLESLTFHQEITSYPNVKAYEFISTEGELLWVLWSLDGNDHSISLPNMPTNLERISANGKPEGNAPAINITVGIAPIFIQY